MRKSPNVRSTNNPQNVLQDFVDYSVRNYDDVGRLLSKAIKTHRNTISTKSK